MWILGGVASYKLWGTMRWLSWLVIVVTAFHGRNSSDSNEGSMSRRLFFETIFIVSMFIYSLTF